MASLLPADSHHVAASSSSRPAIRCIFYLAVFVSLLCYTVVPIIGTDLSRVPGNLGDARLNLYLLEHPYKYITGQAASFWNAGFFYPHPNVIAYSENHIGTFLFFAPFRMVGLDRESAFQCWFLVGFALNFAAMAFVLDRFKFGILAVSLGAAVFAFSPVQILHLDHAQILYRFPIPLAWYFCDRFLDDYRSSSLALALTALSWQFYISMYLGYFVLVLIFFYLIAVVIARNRALVSDYRHATSTHSRLAHVGLLLICIASLLPLYVRYSAPGNPTNSLAEVLDFLPRPVSYLAGSRDKLIEKVLNTKLDVAATFPGEQTLFVGLIPWIALLAGTVIAIRGGDFGSVKLRRVAFMFWGVFWLTLSIDGASLYRFLISAVPPLTGIRAVSRIVHVLLLPFAFMAASVVHRLTKPPLTSLSGSLGTLAAVGACLMFAWETRSAPETMEKAAMQRRIATMERLWGLETPRPRVSPDGPVLAALRLNQSEPAYKIDIDAMLAAQELNMVTLNGYSRFLPPGYRNATDCSTLAGMLRDYERSIPGFSTHHIAGRIRVAPGLISCDGHLDSKASKSAGPLPDDAFRAGISARCLECPTAPGSALKILVDVGNLSQRLWPQDGIFLSARFVKASDGTPLSGFDTRFPVGTDFRPHQSKQFIIDMTAPATRGRFRLEVDLVQESVAWFSARHTKRGELMILLGDSTAADSDSSRSSTPAISPGGRGAVFEYKAGMFDRTLVSGFHDPESWGMWSKADPAEVRFPAPWKGPVRLTLVAYSLAQSPNRVLAVTIGSETHTVSLGEQLTTYTIDFTAASGADRVVFGGARPIPGAELGISDQRRLGFALARIEIEPKLAKDIRR